MNQQAISNLSSPRQAVSGPGDSAQLGSGRSPGIVASVLRIAAHLRRRLAEIGARIERDREVREAIEHLEAMSDSQLRDIGLQRGDIVAAVRFGNRYYVDRESE